MAADFSGFHRLLHLTVTLQTSDARIRTWRAEKNVFEVFRCNFAAPRRSILTNLIFEREFLLFSNRIRSHSAIDDTMAADFSSFHRLLRQTITLQTSNRGCIRVRGNLGTERLQYGHGTAALQAADAYVLQTLLSAYDGGHKSSSSAEVHEVGLETHCKWAT